MNSVRVEWDERGLRNLFCSKAMSDALYKAGTTVAKNATPIANTYLKGKGFRDGYGCKTKKLDKTYVAIVHPRSRAIYGVEMKHHVLYRFK